MSISTLTQTLFGSLLENPAVVEITDHLLDKAVPLIKQHFTFTADEITKAYQDGCGYAFVAISVGLDTPEQNFSLFQKLRHSKVTREFAQKIERHYLQPFAKQFEIQDLLEFRKQAIDSLGMFAKNTNQLFEIETITEENLAALVGYRDTFTITNILLEQMQPIVPIDDTLAKFLRYDELLGNAVLFFFRELLRQDERLAKTQAALQQEGLCLGMREIQAAIDNLKAQQQISSFLVNPEQLKNLEQVQDSWKKRETQLLRFQNRIETSTTEILAWAQDVYTTLDKIEKNTKKTQSVVVENNQILQALFQMLQQRGLSAQVSPRDEFTHYDEQSLKLIQAAVEQLKNLPTQNPEYSQVSINIGSALSAKGDLNKAESLFIQAIENAKNNDETALANFNLFQVRWRKAFTKTTVSEKEELYAQALSALKVAIELSNGRYALHDINTGYYPIVKLLGAGGMGCAFLCENHNRVKTEDELVVVKCFWENITGTLNEVFKEPLAMKHISGVPKPLECGYADNLNKKHPYFVTEYIEGAIDGEAWLETEGNLDLQTGLQVGLQIAECLHNAHENGYIHLDIKPANLLLKRTNQGIMVKIIDFGLARVTSSLREVAEKRSQSGLTVFGQAVFGTLEYAPPEQRGYEWKFGKPSEKSDIFAFGKTMYRLLTGELALEIEREPLEHLPKWHELLSDCVRQNPEKRPESAKVLISRLEELDDNRRIEKEKAEKERARRKAEEEQLRKVQEELALSLRQVNNSSETWFVLSLLFLGICVGGFIGYDDGNTILGGVAGFICALIMISYFIG